MMRRHVNLTHSWDSRLCWISVCRHAGAPKLEHINKGTKCCHDSTPPDIDLTEAEAFFHFVTCWHQILWNKAVQSWAHHQVRPYCVYKCRTTSCIGSLECWNVVFMVVTSSHVYLPSEIPRPTLPYRFIFFIEVESWNKLQKVQDQSWNVTFCSLLRAFICWKLMADEQKDELQRRIVCFTRLALIQTKVYTFVIRLHSILYVVTCIPRHLGMWPADAYLMNLAIYFHPLVITFLIWWATQRLPFKELKLTVCSIDNKSDEYLAWELVLKAKFGRGAVQKNAF